MFLALREMRRAKTRFGLLTAAVGLLLLGVAAALRIGQGTFTVRVDGGGDSDHPWASKSLENLGFLMMVNGLRTPASRNRASSGQVRR